MLERFETHSFRAKSLERIHRVNELIAEFGADGYIMSVRQIHYQLTSENPSGYPNTQKNYKGLVALMSKARLAGLVDWDAFEDRGRHYTTPAAWESPESIMSAVAEQYRERLWDQQPRYAFVLEEKDALLGVIEKICTELRVPYMSCRGHMSQTEMYNLGKLLAQKIAEGYEPYGVYVGDHDPSGVHMTEDVERRLAMFAGAEIEINRVALNMDQVRRLGLPPNPAKEKDTRRAAYVRRFGTTNSWELDALNPRDLAQMIREAVHSVIAWDQWNADLAKEKPNRDTLRTVYEEFSSVKRYCRHRETEVLGLMDPITADEVLSRAAQEDDDA